MWAGGFPRASAAGATQMGGYTCWSAHSVLPWHLLPAPVDQPISELLQGFPLKHLGCTELTP